MILFVFHVLDDLNLIALNISADNLVISRLGSKTDIAYNARMVFMKAHQLSAFLAVSLFLGAWYVINIYVSNAGGKNQVSSSETVNAYANRAFTLIKLLKFVKNVQQAV